MNKIILLIALVLSLSVFAPRDANAAVAACQAKAVACNASVKAGIKALESAVKAGTKGVDKALDTLKKKLNKKIDNVENAIVQAANGLSNNVTSSATNVATNRQKIADVVITKKLQNAKRFEDAKIARNLQPTASDCLVLTDKRNQAGEKAVNKGTADILAEARLQNRNDVNGEGGIRRGARKFQEYTANFCDPDMPNAPANCVSGGMLQNADKNYNVLLGTATVESAAAVAASNVLMESLNPVNEDIISLPAYSTAAGQRAYIAQEAKKTRQNLIDAVLAKMAADRMPTSNTGDDQAKMWERVLGENAPASVVNYYQQNQTDQVSEASKREVERLGAVSYQSSLDAGALSEGGADKKMVADLVDAIEMEYQAYLSEERKNILLALQYAGKIN